MPNPRGTFDPTLVPVGWFDEQGQPIGWFDGDLLSTATTSATAYTLTADAGSYSLTGQDSGVAYAPGAGAYSLTAEFGGYSLSGVDASVKAGRNLPAEFGSYGLAGQAAGVVVGRRVAGEVGAYALTGQDATLTAAGGAAYTLTAEAGLYSIDGQDAGLTGPVVSGGHGFEIVDFESKLWWKRKPRKISEEDAQEKVEQVAKKIVKAVASVPAGRLLPKAGKPVAEDVRKQVVAEIAPMLREMPGFDWQPIFRAIAEAAQRQIAQQAAQAQALQQAEQAATIQAAIEIDRIRRLRDEDDVMALLLA